MTWPEVIFYSVLAIVGIPCGVLLFLGFFCLCDKSSLHELVFGRRKR